MRVLESGKKLLCNNPHLVFTIPAHVSLWVWSDIYDQPSRLNTILSFLTDLFCKVFKIIIFWKICSILRRNLSLRRFRCPRLRSQPDYKFTRRRKQCTMRRKAFVPTYEEELPQPALRPTRLIIIMKEASIDIWVAASLQTHHFHNALFFFQSN